MKLISTFILILTICFSGWSQEVTGTVTDAQGEPLIGVNVSVKSKTIGSITDFNGEFTLSGVESTDTLVVSYIGYGTKEIFVGNDSYFDITLQEGIGLEEVIVVGYGTQKKINLTGAVDQLDVSKDIGERPVPNLTQMLQGVTPNLNISTNNNGGEPGAANNLNIRGTGTLTGNGGTPYILLDGIPITTDQLNSINPDDVKNVSILKDAASSAIYGSRGAYGVILITTKQGEASDRMKVDFSMNNAFAGPTNLPTMANSLDFATAMNQAGINSGQTPHFSESELQDIRDYQAGSRAADTEPNVNGNNWRYWVDGYANYDWYDVMFTDWAPRNQYRLSVSGGNEKNTYYLSGNFFEQAGNLEYADDNYDRVNFTANFKTQTSEWLAFDVSAKYSRENQILPAGGFAGFDKNIHYHQISRMWPVNPFYGPNNEIINFDVLRLSRSGTRDNTINNTLLQIGTDIEPIAGWNTRITYNYNLTDENFERILLRNELQNPDGTFRNVGHNPDQIQRRFRDRNNQLFNIVSSYNTSFSNHNIGIMGGYEARIQRFEEVSARRAGFITPSLPTLSTAVGEQFGDDALNEFSTQGFFTRINYDYNNKYLFEFNARYDGSSFFREGNRWGFFPSASVGYNVAQENFWEPLTDKVNMFKIRASWGQLGNHDPSLANLFQELIPSGTTSWLINGARPVVIGTPGLVSQNLTWETVTTLNFGFDLGFLDDKIEFSFDRYNRTTSDMIGPAIALPELLGTNPPRENNAKLETRGWEAAIRYRGNVGSLGYRIGANISDNITRVLEYNNPTNILSTFREGQELGEIWGFETVGYFESDAAAAEAPDQSTLWGRWGAGDIQYADLNGDGIIDFGENTTDNPGDRRVIGNSTPRYSFGINLGFSYSNFDLSMLFQGVGQRDYVFSRGANLFWGFRGNMWQNSYTVPSLDYWTEDNTNAYFPKPYLNAEHTKNTHAQTRYIQDASFTRLKNIQLSYKIPNSLTKSIGLSNLQIYFSGENLLTLTSLNENFDPEALGGAWGEGKIYPLQRVLSFGLNASL